jgi:hypothetical protein
LDIKAREANWTSRIFSPLTTTLLAGILALGASASGAFLQGREPLLLEREKQQHELILKMISVGDEKQARANMEFLADIGLLADEALAKRLLASKTQGVLPTSGAPLILPIIIPGCEPLSLNFNNPAAQESWLCRKRTNGVGAAIVKDTRRPARRINSIQHARSRSIEQSVGRD